VIRRTVTIRNRLGLHARAAARFVHAASRFACRVTLSRGGRTMDGKSILGILLLSASQGAELVLAAEGEDAAAAVAALGDLVEGGFGEDGGVGAWS
jgi:phosphocarrier protein